MMSLNLPLGSSNFKEVVQGNYYFIDKSLFIESILDDPAKVILLPRPRRFGKTLNLSMLYYFLEGFIETSHDTLFDDLLIKHNQPLCQKYQNQSPVILISLKEMKKNNFQDAFLLFKNLISSLYRQYYHFLFNSLNKNDKLIYERLLNKTGDISELQFSLFYLCQWSFEKTGQNSFILIDEYDAPITESYVRNYYDDMLDLLRGFLSTSLKENQYLAKGVLTGITRIAKESIFSDLNHFEVYSVLDPSFPQYFGFTEGEVEQLLIDDGHPEQKDSIKAWYNGYHFGGVTLYNPWSILKCVKRGYLFEPYWINTSSNNLIKSLLTEAKAAVKSTLTRLLQGEVIEQRIDETLVFSELNISEQALWTLMLSSGYVTSRSYQIFRGSLLCQLEIPNREIAGLYEKIIEFWFSSTAANEGYDTFIHSLVEGNIEQFSRLLNHYLQQSGSYFDFNQHSPEKVFHTFVLGLVVGLRDNYFIHSNKESGLGRFDVLLQPKQSNVPGIILEFKTTDDEATLQETANKALDQIKDKEYFSTLKQHQTPKALLLGIAFCGQQALIASKQIDLF